jgi:hypothetical protein
MFEVLALFFSIFGAGFGAGTALERRPRDEGEGGHSRGFDGMTALRSFAFATIKSGVSVRRI